MTPREIIAKCLTSHLMIDRGQSADEILISLVFSGYRILGPGELDLDTVEECAEVVEPKGPRPCDCDRCDCGNVIDRELVTAWDQQAESAFAIRALAKEIR